MKNPIIEDIKARRKKIKVSQQILAKAAKISLATLTQLELGNHKPQSRTIKKIITALEELESTSSDAPVVDTPKRKRGRPRKNSIAKTSTRTIKTKPVKVATDKPKKKPASLIPPVPEPVTTTAVSAEVSQPIKLSNVDLELINRILNMSGAEKLDLLRKLI